MPTTKGVGESRKVSQCCVSGRTGMRKCCQEKGRSKGMRDSTQVLSRPMLGQNTTQFLSSMTPAAQSRKLQFAVSKYDQMSTFPPLNQYEMRIVVQIHKYLRIR